MKNSLLVEIVQFLGLNELEAKVYEYLISHKNINITEISKLTLANRTQIYEVLEVLTKFDLITKPVGRNKEISIINPKNILIKLRQKQLETEKYLKQFQQILPDLEQLQALSNSSIPIKITQGKVEFEDLFLEMYENAKDELFFIGNSDEFYNFLGENYVDFAIQKRLKKAVSHRVLTFQPAVNLENKARIETEVNREVRYLPAKFSSLGYINIYNNRVVNWNTVLARAVVIEDVLIASFYKIIFEILWELCENKPPHQRAAAPSDARIVKKT